MRTAVVLPAPFGPSTPRMVPAGTIVGVLATGEAVFGEVPMAELAEHVRGAVHDLLESAVPAA